LVALALFGKPLIVIPTIQVSVLITYPFVSGGAGPRGFLATLSQYMLGSAASFSFFLAIGSVSSLDLILGA